MISRELWLRQQAIRLKYAGWSIRTIWTHVERSREGFCNGWKRRHAEGGGLRDRFCG